MRRALLTNFIHGSESPITTRRFGLRKLTETTPEMLRSIHANSSFTVNTCAMSPPPQLFGVPVETGVITWHFERARLKNRDQFAMRLKRAEIGDSIDAILQVNGPVRVFALGQVISNQPVKCHDPEDRRKNPRAISNEALQWPLSDTHRAIGEFIVTRSVLLSLVSRAAGGQTQPQSLEKLSEMWSRFSESPSYRCRYQHSHSEVSSDHLPSHPTLVYKTTILRSRRTDCAMVMPRESLADKRIRPSAGTKTMRELIAYNALGVI